MPGVVNPGQSGGRALAASATCRTGKACDGDNRLAMLIAKGAGDKRRRPLLWEQRGR